MKDSLDEFVTQYRAALREYVERGGEDALARAYELGRKAVGEGLGLLQVVAFYHEALETVLHGTPMTGGMTRALKAREFLNESLAPFEMTHRGFQEANAQLRESNEALQQINAELEAFGYTVSHDLRAPLRHMQGFAQALLEDYAERLEPAAKDYAQHIVTAARRMDNLIRDLLDYGRLSRDRMFIRAVSLASVAEDVLTHIDNELRERGAKVTVEMSRLVVLGDRITLEQVLINLMTNAVKFVPVGVKPDVRISVEERGDWARLWVKDNGIGIPLEQQEHIFEVFRRLHDTKSYPGTGIGLAIVRKGVTRMGGRVGVESAPGRGSAFWLELRKAVGNDEHGT